MQLLLELVSMCERLGAQLRATIIANDDVRKGDIERLVDRSAAVRGHATHRLSHYLFHSMPMLFYLAASSCI